MTSAEQPGRPGRLWIGPSGWSYADWHGVFYPARGRASHPLAFLSQFFHAVEVNSSFYRIPTPRATATWPALVPREFRFTFKLTRTFTHEPEIDPSAADAAAFREALAPIRSAGMLGPILFQFPWSFRFGRPAIERLQRLGELFENFERTIEVRHTSWLCDDGQAAIRACGGFCNIDQPALRDCIGPTARVHGASAYVRLHGRNAATWFADGLPAYERYNYLYSLDELRDWADRIQMLRQSAADVYVFANNHFRAQGPANALELRFLIEHRRQRVPITLLEAYPRLREIATPPLQPGLFDHLA